MRLTELAADRQGEWSALLSPCRELRELELDMTIHGDKEAEIISSITSSSIRKISLVYRWSVASYSWRTTHWGTLNEPLCQLVDRLGSTHGLEVEIRTVDVGGGGTYEDTDLGVIVSSLAAFREKGRIRLVYVDRDKRAHVFYPPDLSSTNRSRGGRGTE